VFAHELLYTLPQMQCEAFIQGFNLPCLFLRWEKIMIIEIPVLDTEYLPDYAPAAYVVEWIEEDNLLDELEKYFIQQEEQ
jgi:hypothetical protein